MKLSLADLENRHEYWKLRICEKGIWDAGKFKPVKISIRPSCRSYHAMFKRKIRRKLFRVEYSDHIWIYNRVEDFEEKFLDSILVHEMIHQYITQASLKDSRTHGPLFREFMKRINTSFPEELKIKVTDRNPSVPSKGEGEKIHDLLIVRFEDNTFICAVLHPSRIEHIEKLVKRHKKLWRVKNMERAVSKDLYFNRFRRCMKSFHGIRKNWNEKESFYRLYNISKI